jgi:hypothetical protein
MREREVKITVTRGTMQNGEETLGADRTYLFELK